MASQYLFAYGTLKSDQPEHKTHCTPPLSIKPAKAPGRLWRLREGYPILEIAPETSILDATRDTAADWEKASAFAENASPALPADDHWIDGELFEYPLESNGLHKMDTWENFVPGQKGPYQRRVIWVKDEDGNDLVAWAYVCFSPPNWATLLKETSWKA